MTICICCQRMTYDHCRECTVPLCWPCGISGLCGMCVRMEMHRREHHLSLSGALYAAPLILSEEIQPWGANLAKIYSNEETELLTAEGRTTR